MARFYGEFIEDFPVVDAGGCKFRCYTSKIKPGGKAAYYRMFCQKADKKCKPYVEKNTPDASDAFKETASEVIPQRVSTKSLVNITDEEAIKLLLNPDIKLTDVQKRGLIKIANSKRERIIPQYSYPALARKYRQIGEFKIRVGLNIIVYYVVESKTEEEQKAEPPPRTVAWIFRVKKEDIKKETEKAVGVDLGTDKLVWIPKSVIKGWCFKPEGYIVEEWYAQKYARTGGPFIPINEETKRTLLESGHWVEK